MRHSSTIIVIVALTNCLVSCNNQGAYQIAASIEAGNKLESSHVGMTGTPSSQWRLYEQLKKVATEEELIKLTDHKNAVVRCYAFQALASRRSKNIFPILLKHLTDTARVKTQTYDMGGTELVGDYFLNVVTPNYIELDVYKLNAKERGIVDSILTNDNSISLFSQIMVLQSLDPTGKNYSRIRELVSKDRNTSALITLARYKKAEDKELISSFFSDRETQYSALFAVREYPDEYFFPFVKKAFEQEWEYSEQKGYDYPKWRMCYQTLAKYPNIETLKLFERTLKTKDEFRYNILCTNLMTALTKYPNKFYNSIKERIKLPDNYLDDVKEQLSYEDER